MELMQIVLINIIKNSLKKKTLILKIQHRFKSERHYVFTDEINKIALNYNDEKRMQSIHTRETYAYGTNKDLISEKEEIKLLL